MQRGVLLVAAAASVLAAASASYGSNASQVQVQTRCRNFAIGPAIYSSIRTVGVSCSVNPCESMLEIVRRTQRNVKRWSSGEMALRWTAAGMLEAEKQFRKIIGYRDLATLVIAIERDHDRRRHAKDHASTEKASFLGC